MAKHNWLYYRVLRPKIILNDHKSIKYRNVQITLPNTTTQLWDFITNLYKKYLNDYNYSTTPEGIKKETLVYKFLVHF